MRKIPLQSPHHIIDKCNIEQGKSIEILIDENLNWQNHIDLVTEKIL